MIDVKINQKSAKLHRVNQLLQKIYKKLLIEYRNIDEYYQKRIEISLKRCDTKNIRTNKKKIREKINIDESRFRVEKNCRNRRIESKNKRNFQSKKFSE